MVDAVVCAPAADPLSLGRAAVFDGAHPVEKTPPIVAAVPIAVAAAPFKKLLREQPAFAAFISFDSPFPMISLSMLISCLRNPACSSERDYAGFTVESIPQGNNR